MKQLKVKRLRPDAIIPKYATSGAACFDLHQSGRIEFHKNDPEARIFCTGLSFEVPKDHVMLIFSRSGHGFNYGLRLSNCVGVIDSDYRGEVKVSLRADCEVSPASEINLPCARIAQAMVIPVQQFSFLEVDELSDTERGTGGFGSTGV